jgi:hypothetical protein
MYWSDIVMKIIRGLALIVVIGVLGMMRLPQSQAAPPKTSYAEMLVISPPLVVRKCGQKVPINVKAYWITTPRDDGPTVIVLPIVGAHISVQGGRTGGATLGKISPQTAVTLRTFGLATGLTTGYGSIAEFEYEPDKLGREFLVFEADLPASPGSAHTVKFKDIIHFEVVPCFVNVEAAYIGVWPIQNSTFYWNGIMDEVTVEADENGQLHGEGTMVYTQTVSGLPACSAAWSTLEMSATVSGEVAEDQLHLNFAFVGGERSVTTTCPITGTMSSSIDSDPSPLFNAPISVPTEGGVITYISPFNPPPGTVFVVVTPVEEEEATSDSGSHALAALSAWFVGWPRVSE